MAAVSRFLTADGREATFIGEIGPPPFGTTGGDIFDISPNQSRPGGRSLAAGTPGFPRVEDAPIP
jgi:hypothetical protein